MEEQIIETITVTLFNTTVSLYDLVDEEIVPNSGKMERFDAIFTDRRCFLLPIKEASFWKGLDWVALGRLGGPFGVLLAHSAHAVTSGVKSMFKPQSKFSISELDHLAAATGADIIFYDRIVKFEGLKMARGLMQMLYFDPADISVHITTRESTAESARSRRYRILFCDSEKAVRGMFVRAGIRKELQVRNVTEWE